MLIQQFFTPQIAHSSYILAGGKSCAVVDPQRDVDIYLDVAHAQHNTYFTQPGLPPLP